MQDLVVRPDGVRKASAVEEHFSHFTSILFPGTRSDLFVISLQYLLLPH